MPSRKRTFMTDQDNNANLNDWLDYHSQSPYLPPPFFPPPFFPPPSIPGSYMPDNFAPAPWFSPPFLPPPFIPPSCFQPPYSQQQNFENPEENFAQNETLNFIQEDENNVAYMDSSDFNPMYTENDNFTGQVTEENSENFLSYGQNLKNPDLMPIGIFWDIENCMLKNRVSKFAFVQNLRSQYIFHRFRELEFVCVCDTNSIDRKSLEELNLAQVNVIHVNNGSKNAADDKLKQLINRFVDMFLCPVAIFLISCDVNFISVISDIRYRKGAYTILLCREQVSPALLFSVNEAHNFMQLVQEVEDIQEYNPKNQSGFRIFLTNIPSELHLSAYVLQSLTFLIENCWGGNLLHFKKGCAVVRFYSFVEARRALINLNNFYLLGKKLNAESLYTTKSDFRIIRDYLKKIIPDPKPIKIASPIMKSPPCRSQSRSSKSSSTFRVKTEDAPPQGFAKPLINGENFNLLLPTSVALQKPSAARKLLTPKLDSRPQSPWQVAYRAPSAISADTEKASPVELLITNLDSALEQGSMKKALSDLFRQHQIPFSNVQILTSQHLPAHLAHYTSFFKHLPSCYLKAVVKVPSHQEAQLAVSQLHRAKLGNKRIVISYLSSDKLPPTTLLREEIASIFDDIPSKKLPLVAFQELYEKRYHRNLPMADIYKMKDVIQLCSANANSANNDSSGKYVQLNPEYQAQSSTTNNTRSGRNSISEHSVTSSSSTSAQLGNIHLQKCSMHPQDASLGGWAEQENTLSLPMVTISIKVLSSRVHTLLQLHAGNMPLGCLLNCYTSEFKEVFEINGPHAVPLEHLLTCIPGIQISYCPLLGYKQLQWAEKGEISSTGYRMVGGRGDAPSRPASSLSSASSRPSSSSGLSDNIAKQTSQFCREVRDLLKNQPGCLVAFSKFVPAYHNHFGRQCCVYQYGYTKLIDLLESVSHVLHVLGDSAKRQITLTHREQTKRFAADLLRVLKAQPAKRLLLSQLPELYEQTLGRKFRIEDYGVCFVEDILADVWEGTVLITPTVNEQGEADKHVEIPKREQTEEEKQRTKAFSIEVIELLRSTPTLSMSFSKFIPFYHHYYNRQCKVSEFGFSKLIELLEALAEICIELLPGELAGDEKIIRLNCEQRKAALFARFHEIIKNSGKKCVTVEHIERAFRSQYGFQVNYLEYEADGLCEFLSQMPSMFELEQPMLGQREEQAQVSIVDERLANEMRKRTLVLLLETPEGALDVKDFHEKYFARWGSLLDKRFLQDPAITRHVEQVGDELRLQAAVCFVRDCVLIIQSSKGQLISIKQLEDTLKERMGRLPKALDYGYKTWVQLFNAYGEFVIINKRQDQGRIKWVITVNKSNIEQPLRMNDADELNDRPLISFEDADKDFLTNGQCTLDTNQSNLNQCEAASISLLDMPLNEMPGVPNIKLPVFVPNPPGEWVHDSIDGGPLLTGLLCSTAEPVSKEKKRKTRMAANFQFLKS